LRQFCQKSISKQSSQAPFKQTDLAVKDGSTFYIPLPGFYEFVKKKSDKRTADRTAKVILTHIGATKPSRKGSDRIPFYKIEEHQLYVTDSVPFEAGIGEDNLSGTANPTDEGSGQNGSSAEFWEEECGGSESEDRSPDP
jgi:hypothetical protein